MQKIVSLFARNYDGDRLVRDEIVPGAEWVIAGEGRPTEKFDGTSVLYSGHTLYKRYDAKKGRTPPEGWEPLQPEPDPNTGHWPGWLPVGEGPDDRWHREALTTAPAGWEGDDELFLADGDTYELVGPKVQGNPYGLSEHQFWRHGSKGIEGDPRTFADVRAFLETAGIEGIVWHHEDGRLVKIKARDFGIKWPVPRG